jgi:16S rRNA (cytosine1402-N4)-methyltransferase
MSQQDEEKAQAHKPVLLTEVIDWLQPARGGTFVDCTLGLGGHAEAILKASDQARVIGLDRDLEALGRAEKRLKMFENRFQAVHADFRDLADVLDRLGVNDVRGVIADLGVSSLQLDTADRGFSFAEDAPLDMRMDRTGGRTAADLVNHLAESELADLIFEYGEERASRRVARAIVRERQLEPILTTKRLAETVVRALKQPGRWRIHPATRTFQALRIAVNEELEAVTTFIPQAVSKLESGGRLAIISFHSLEDRIVKRSFLRESGRCTCQAETGGLLARSGFEMSEREQGRIDDEIICKRCGATRRVGVLTRKPIRPTPEEVERNPRSRSALLRVCERI